MMKTRAASIQNLINWFVFFLAFPALSILGNSITFYLFIAIVLRVGIFWKKDFKGKMLLFSFMTIVVLSTLLAPYSELGRHPGMISAIEILVQYIYWILLASFFIVFNMSINYIQLSKWLFYGTIAAIVSYYFVGINIDLSLIEITLKQSRNGFVFTLLCAIPICFYYLKKQQRTISMGFYLLFFLLAMLYTNGRSGAVIVIIQLLLVSTILYPTWNRLSRYVIIPLLGIFLLLQSDKTHIYSAALAHQVESVNPRFAALIRQEGEGDLTQDKSWLMRRLMIDKGIEISKEYPIFGIGPNNFTYYDSEFSTIRDYNRLQSRANEYYNNRSAHNSYIQILSELGYIGLFILVLIIAIPLVHLVKFFWRTKLELAHLPLLSLLGMSMHFYAISSLTGAVPWLIFGLAWASTVKGNRD